MLPLRPLKLSERRLPRLPPAEPAEPSFRVHWLAAFSIPSRASQARTIQPSLLQSLRPQIPVLRIARNLQSVAPSTRAPAAAVQRSQPRRVLRFVLCLPSQFPSYLEHHCTPTSSRSDDPNVAARLGQHSLFAADDKEKRSPVATRIKPITGLRAMSA